MNAFLDANLFFYIQNSIIDGIDYQRNATTCENLYLDLSFLGGISFVCEKHHLIIQKTECTIRYAFIQEFLVTYCNGTNFAFLQSKLTFLLLISPTSFRRQCVCSSMEMRVSSVNHVLLGELSKWKLEMKGEWILYEWCAETAAN